MGSSQRRSDRTKRRRKRDAYEIRAASVPVGPGIVAASLEEVMAAVERVPDPRDWEAVSHLVLPMFPRRRPFAVGDLSEPLRLWMPPGVLVGFGVDLGRAFAYVDASMLEAWPVTTDGLTTVALRNVRDRLALSSPRALERVDLDGVAARVLMTGLGIASTTVLLPDELRRIFGSGPQRFVAPMRDLLVSFPLAADPIVAQVLVEDLAERDPNALAVESFVLDAGQLRCEPLGTPAGLA